MSARLLAGAGAVLRREGLVRALDLAAGRPHSVARIDCPRGKKNSTFFENMGYRGQSCDDWQMLMMSLVDPFFDDLFNEKC